MEAQGLALWQRLVDEANVAQDWMHARLQHCLSTAADADADASPATTPAAAANGGATRASVATPRPVHADAGAPPDGRLGAAGALELALLGDRYMLDGLSLHAHRRLRAALTAAEVVPLLLRAQEECSSAAAQVIFGWAVEHYEQVHALLDAWLTCAPSARPHVPRLLGDKALLALSTNLRTEMLRVRHGL